MQPKMCTKCKKNIAVVFITKIENGNTLNEGYCLKCARSLGIPQIDAAVKQMGISEDDLELLSDEMASIFGQKDDPVTISGYQFVFGGVVLSAIGFAMGGRLVFYSVSCVLMLISYFLYKKHYKLDEEEYERICAQIAAGK